MTALSRSQRRWTRATFGIMALWLVVPGACGSSGHLRGGVVLDPVSSRHRLHEARLAARDRPVRLIWTYRHLISPLLASRCRMFPGDSEHYVHERRSCGTWTALVRAVSRMFLEVAASPEFLPMTVNQARLQFVDLPTDAPCGR